MQPYLIRALLENINKNRRLFKFIKNNDGVIDIAVVS